MNQAYRLNSNLAYLASVRGRVRSQLGDYQGAIVLKLLLLSVNIDRQLTTIVLSCKPTLPLMLIVREVMPMHLLMNTQPLLRITLKLLL
jgi:hypothetical protein